MSKKFIIIVSLLSAVLIVFFGILPRYSEAVSLKDQEAAKTTELRQQESYLEEIKILSREIDSRAEGLKKTNTALPEESDLLSVLNFIVKSGSQNGIIVKNIGAILVNPLKDGSGLEEVSFDLSLIGSYPSFRNFLTSLEKSSRIISIEKVFINQEDSAEEGGAAITFGLKLKTLSY